ncbi:unnamed protein product [Caretta caretta]
MQQHTEQSFETDADTKQEITTVETVLAWDIDDIGIWPQSLNNEFHSIILEKGPGRIKGLEYPKDIRAHVNGITVKPLSETHWQSRVESAKTLRYQSEEAYEALVAISEEARDPKAKSEAQSFASEISSFKFLTSVIIWYDILVKISSVSKIMQSPMMQFDSTLTLLDNTRDFLVKYRENGFREAQVTARELVQALSVEPKFPCLNVTRVSRKKRQAEYEGADEPIDDPEKKFEDEFFNVVMDKAISAIDERFNTLQAHHEQFGFLYDITKFNEIGKQEQETTKCKNLESLLKYSDWFDLNGLELYEELSTLSSMLPHAKSVIGHCTVYSYQQTC